MGLKYLLRIDEDEMEVLYEILDWRPIDPATHRPEESIDRSDPIKGSPTIGKEAIIRE